MVRRLAGCVALFLGLYVVATGFETSVVPMSATAQAASPGAALSPVTPCRLLDTRQGAGGGAGQRIGAGVTTRIPVSGRCGVKAGGSAVSVTVTATDATGAGFLTLSAAGSARPTASNLNFRPGAAVANSAVVQLSADGSIDVYVSAAAHVLVDVAGVFSDVAGPTSSGRFVPLPPARLVDTRAAGAPAAGDLTLARPAGVASDATAVAISVTVTDPASPVYVTVHPAGSPRPTSSVVNSDPLERARTVTVLAPVTANGLIVHRSAPAHVVIDVIGWFTGPSAPASTDGLFVVQSPTRVWDSRVTSDPVHAGGTAERALVAQPAAAVLVNVTAIDSTAPGYISAFAAGTPQPYVSMLNVTWRDPLASMSIVSMSTRGAAFYGSAGMHVVVDVAGVFRGVASSPTQPPPLNTMPATGGSVLFLSDSSLAGIRWSGQLGSLQGASITANLESCRRLIGVSCRGREGYAPSTATSAIASAPGKIDVLVIGVGYNDFSSTFPAAFDAVVGAARARGIPRIVWLTYRESVTYASPQDASHAANYVTYNGFVRAALGSGRYPDVVLADWNTYGAPRPEWFTGDGVHVNPLGAWAAGTYVSRTLAFLDRRPCPAGLGGAVTPGGWCASPDVTGPPA